MALRNKHKNWKLITQLIVYFRFEKKVGDAVAADEVVMEIETDKTTVGVPSPGHGIIEEIYVADGDTVKAGQQLFKLKITGEAPAKAVPKAESKPAAAAPPKAPEPPKPAAQAPPPPPPQAAVSLIVNLILNLKLIVFIPNFRLHHHLHRRDQLHLPRPFPLQPFVMHKRSMQQQLNCHHSTTPRRSPAHVQNSESR